MKTLNSLSQKMQDVVAMLPLILPLIITLFCMASCSKEDSVKPSLNQAAASHSDLKQVNLDADVLPSQIHNGLAITYTVAKIEHRGGRSLLPTYTVTIQSDGLIIYEGIHNVYKAEKIGWRISPDNLTYIKFLFYSSHFYQIRDTLVPNVDAPVNLTSYKENIEALNYTLVDINDGYPQMVIQTRQKVEDMLNISALVKAPTRDLTASAKYSN
jgi:hypothetical protein